MSGMWYIGTGIGRGGRDRRVLIPNERDFREAHLGGKEWEEKEGGIS